MTNTYSVKFAVAVLAGLVVGNAIFKMAVRPAMVRFGFA